MLRIHTAVKDEPKAKQKEFYDICTSLRPELPSFGHYKHTANFMQNLVVMFSFYVFADFHSLRNFRFLQIHKCSAICWHQELH